MAKDTCPTLRLIVRLYADYKTLLRLTDNLVSTQLISLRPGSYYKTLYT